MWKKGQKVVVPQVYQYDHVAMVERVTHSGLAVVEGIHYKQDGNICGASSYQMDYIIPATEEDEKRINEENFIRSTINYLRNKINTLTFDQAVAIRKILKNKTD